VEDDAMRRRLPLARSIGEAHRRYTRMVNFREGWRGECRLQYACAAHFRVPVLHDVVWGVL